MYKRQEIRSTEERTRLKTIVQSVIKSGYGAIIRTQAAGKDVYKRQVVLY